jgi:glycerol-3-phosphate acyltransferase PlsY
MILDSIAAPAIPVGAYLLGSIPFGLILAKLFGGSDVRKEGSGNIGATNVARVAGPLAGTLTLLLDAGKGTAAVLLAMRLSHDSAAWMMIAGLAALVGHCFPVWLKFKGGKGVATAVGVFLAMAPLPALAALGVFVVIVGIWRYVSLGSIVAAAMFPVFFYFLEFRKVPGLWWSLIAAVLCPCLIIWRHRENIQRLVAGTESRLMRSKK